MGLEHLVIERFRLIDEARLDLSPGINLFVGGNAQGKTTVLEAAGYLSTGRSFRAARDRECVSWTAPPEMPFAAIEGTHGAEGGRRTVRLAIEKSRKSVWIGGHALRSLSGLWGLMPSVLFAPTDLALVQGAPALRRSALDTLIGQIQPSYLRMLASMNRALSNRNSLIRRRVAPRNVQYEAFEATLAESAAPVLRERLRLAGKLGVVCGYTMRALTRDKETLGVAFEPGFMASRGLSAECLLEMTADELADGLAKAWRAARADDFERGTTREGPHRDDLRFEIDGRDARAYASQGQARSIVLAIRLAELELLQESGGRDVLLLLDDILGDLDTGRTRRFLELVSNRKVQTLLTATNAVEIEDSLPISRRFVVEKGHIERAARP